MYLLVSLCAAEFFNRLHNQLFADRTPPRFKNNCPIFLNVSADSGKTSATVYWNKVSATDSGGRVTLSVEPEGASSPRTFPEGTNTITYLATDVSNNRASCQLKVTVHGN